MITKRLVSIVKKSSAQNHVVIMCVCFLFVSMLIIGAYMSLILYQQARKSTSEKMYVYADKTVESLQQTFSYTSNITMSVATSKMILQWINNASVFDPDSAGYYQNLTSLKNEARYILTCSNAWENSYVSYIAIFFNDQLLMYTFSKPFPQGVIIRSCQSAYESFQNRQPQFVANVQSFMGDSQIFHVRMLKPIYSRNQSLVIMVATDEEVLRQQYSQSQYVGHSISYLVDEQGVVFSASDAAAVGQPCAPAIREAIEAQATQVTVAGEDFMLIAKPIQGHHLTFVTLVSTRYIVEQALDRLPGFVAICLGLCVCLLLIGLYVSLRSTGFIRDLAYGMEQVKEKNYDVKMPPYNNQAIDLLSLSFNDMTNAMKKLVNDTYESKILLQETQLAFLQQQVNPHFLFNVLLTIQIKAQMCADETIYGMLTSLSGFLRAGLYESSNMFTTLEEELQCIQFYLYLQKQRFGDKLNYTIDVPDDLRQKTLPRLSIQTFVENAVVHGLEGFEKPVAIRVHAETVDSDMRITVRDNGSGFDALSFPWDQKPEVSSPKRDRIGLQNTNHRLKLLYGEAYCLQIESALEQGTKVTMRIPLERG